MKLPHKLDYYISSASSFLPGFPPENVLIDDPLNVESRWTSDSQTRPQYLYLNLHTPAFVRRIQIGKTNSVSNSVKRLRVFGGVDLESLNLLLDVILQDDQLAETFTLRSPDGRPVPCRVIKIEPLESWDHSSVFSIYSISLFGYEEKESIFNSELHRYKYHKRSESLRLCMKLLRQENLSVAFSALASSVPEIQLEHPLLTQLYDALITNANFTECETVLQQLCDAGILNKGHSDDRCQIQWRRIHDVSDSPEFPSRRGGHQMALDAAGRRIYLFGGWTGERDLSDFWCFEMDATRWRLISADASQQGGPTPRSCHKMVADPKRQLLYVLGKYPGPRTRRNSDAFHNEFYRYLIDVDKWEKLSSNTAEDDGPPVIYDHQMTIHVEKNVIFVFGGKQLVFDPDRRGFSSQCSEWPGLYRYAVSSCEWSVLKQDCNQLPSRMGHCMVLDPINDELYIFGGNRNRELVKTLCVYDVNTGKLQRLNDRNSLMKIAHTTLGYTQRATIDPERSKIYVYSGIRKDSLTKPGQHTSFWMYDMEAMSWSCVYQNSSLSTANDSEPMPRYAHQLAYDPVHKLHYLFGGNPACREAPVEPSARLNDFWSFALHRPCSSWPLRRCRYWLRRQQFRELLEAAEGPGGPPGAHREQAAVHLLQNCLFNAIDHSKDREREELHVLASWVLRGTGNTEEDFDWEASKAWRTEFDPKQQRLLVWRQICSFVPLHLQEPRKSVADLVPT